LCRGYWTDAVGVKPGTGSSSESKPLVVRLYIYRFQWELIDDCWL
jgi:hypothetical protein